jgi:hypothetical protein
VTAASGTENAWAPRTIAVDRDPLSAPRRSWSFPSIGIQFIVDEPYSAAGVS